MATQWSKECFCGDDIEVDYGRHGEAECNHRCAGDKVRCDDAQLIMGDVVFSQNASVRSPSDS